MENDGPASSEVHSDTSYKGSDTVPPRNFNNFIGTPTFYRSSKRTSEKRRKSDTSSAADERPSDPAKELEEHLSKYLSLGPNNSPTSKVPIKRHVTVGAWSGHGSRLDRKSTERTESRA